MRTIIEVPQEQLEALDLICRREGISRAEAIRRAVARHIQEERRTAGDPAFGLWRKHPIDGLAYERRLRQEWERTAISKRADARRKRA